MTATIEQALAEVYASAPLDQLDVDTLEIWHPSFVDDQGNPAPIFLAIGYDADPEAPFRARLEPDAPRRAGELIEFVAAAIKFQRPDVEEGQLPQIKLELDNVDRAIVQYIELAQGQPAPIEILYRPYLLSDPSAPQMDPPLMMEVVAIEANVFTVSLSASMADVFNFPFPQTVYTPDRFPGLLR